MPKSRMKQFIDHPVVNKQAMRPMLLTFN